MSNKTLVMQRDEALLSVDGVSIESLIQAHYAVLYRYAYRLTGSQCDAEDLTQQSFLTAHTKLHQLRESAAARGWLFQILRSMFYKMCRKRKPVLESDVEMEMGCVIDEQIDQPFDLERLQLRLDELNESYRVILLMFYFEEKSYSEIATELDIPLGTVMSRLSRAKSQLRTRIQTEATQ